MKAPPLFLTEDNLSVVLQSAPHAVGIRNAERPTRTIAPSSVRRLRIPIRGSFILCNSRPSPFDSTNLSDSFRFSFWSVEPPRPGCGMSFWANAYSGQDEAAGRHPVRVAADFANWPGVFLQSRMLICFTLCYPLGTWSMVNSHAASKPLSDHGGAHRPSRASINYRDAKTPI